MPPTPRLTVTLFILVVLIIAAACGGTADDEAAPTPDSASVSVLTLQGDEQAPMIDLDVVAGVPLAFADPAVVLHGVIGGVRLPNDGIALGSRFTSQIVFYDARGRGQATFGREGGGPGEFARLASILRIGGDTIAALDGQHRRISLLSAQGGLIRDYSIQPPGNAAPVGHAEAVGHLGAGRLLMWLQTMPGEAELAQLNRPNSVGQIPVVLFAIDAQGASAQPIGVFAGEDQYMGTSIGSQQLTSYGPAPFGRWTRFGVHDGRIYVFNNEAGSIEVHSPEGRLLSTFRTPWRPRVVNDSDRTRLIDEWVRRSPRQEEWEDRRAHFQQLVFPTVMPLYRDAVLGWDGIIWLEPYSQWDGARRLYVGYNAEGVAVRRLSMGYRDQILQIGHDQALLRRYQDDDTEAVRIVSIK